MLIVIKDKMLLFCLNLEITNKTNINRDITAFLILFLKIVLKKN